MIRRGIALRAATGIVAAWPCAAAAQAAVSIDAGVAGIRYADTVSVTAASVGPTLRYETAMISLDATGSHAQLVGAGGATSWTSQGAVAASVFSPTLATLAGAALRGEVAASGGMSAHQDRTRTGQWNVAARTHLMGDHRGAWAGGGAGRTWDGVVWRDTRGADVGAWLRVGRAMLTATARPTWVSLDGAGRIQHTDLELATRVAMGPVELGGVLAARAARAGDVGDVGDVAGDERVWGSGSVTVRLTGPLALVGSAGTYPVDFTQGFPGGRFASLALRVTPWRRTAAPRVPGVTAERDGATAAFDVTATTRGLHRLRVRASRATRVEVAGSFSAWAPVALRAGGDGWWSVELPITAGAHEIALRVDGGEWQPPPGLVVVTDELGGAVGLLVIP